MKDVHQIIEQLSPGDASAILHALASSDATVAGHTSQKWRALFGWSSSYRGESCRVR